MWNPFLKNLVVVLLLGSLNVIVVSGELVLTDLVDGVDYDPVRLLLTIPETLTNEAGSSPFMVLGTILSSDCEDTENCVIDGNHDILIAVEKGQLILKQQLDYDNVALCPNQGFDCRKNARFYESKRPNQVVLVTVSVVAENDNKPYFTVPENCRTLNVKENEDIGINLCELEATDGDFADRSNVGETPTIVAKLEDSTFELLRQPGTHKYTLKLKDDKFCNYEQSYIHRLQISLTDNFPEHESTVESVVQVEDLPDELPVWSQLRPSTRIPETHAEETEVLRFNAIDGDRGVNDKMDYAITKVGPSEGDEIYFKIAEDTATNEGIILLATPLVASELMESRGSLMFEVEVQATERGLPNDKIQETISITVEGANLNGVLISVNDEPPKDKVVITRTCKETDNEFVISLTATDKDVDRRHNTYEASLIPAGGEDLPAYFLNAFVLEKSTGVSGDLTGNGQTEYRISVKNVDSIDYDTIEEWQKPEGFTFKVAIKGDGFEAAEATITIIIENENDNYPNFPDDQQFEVLVEENQILGYELNIVLNSEDGDAGEEFGKSSLKYEWDPNSRIPAYLEFQDPTKGIISVTTAEAFDYEMFKTETFIVRVSDNRDGIEGSRKNSITVPVVITVVNINDEQPSIRAVPSRLSIEEGTNSFIENEFKLIPFDLDDELSNLVCTLSIEDYAEDSDVHNWFKVDPTVCDTIQVVGIIDREIDLKENKGSYIERITVKLQIEDMNTAEGYKEEKSKDEIRMTISIIDKNDEKPEFRFENEDIVFTESNFKVGDPDPDEGNLVKRKIVDIIATDNDTNTVYTFDIIDNDYPDMIELGSGNPNSNGRISLQRIANKPIDREALDEDRENDLVKVTVKVSDGVQEEVIIITIRIEDIDDNAPDFQTRPAELHVKENFNADPQGNCNDISQELYTIIATDADLCDEDYSKYGCVSYVFDQDQSTFQGFAIGLTTGELTTDGCSIDREVLSEIQLKIRAYGDFRDGRPTQPGRFDDLTIRIIIDDINDNRPVFLTPSEGFLSETDEEVAALTNVATIEIQDKDRGENATMTAEILEITCEKNGDEYEVDHPFRIKTQNQIGETLTVQLETTDDFDFTYAYGIYRITFNVTDGGKESKFDEKTYTIKINDINNNDPIMDDTYDEENFSILSGAQVGSIFIADGTPLPFFNATDDDEPNNPNAVLLYFINEETSEPELWKTYFTMNATTGELQLNRRWDYDITGPLTFRICAKANDTAKPPKMSKEEVCYVLNIREPNKPPYFGKTTPPMIIDENSPANADVGTFEAASNADIGDPIIYYTIAGFGGDVKNFFTLKDRTKNVLSTAKSLDREYKDVHEVLIFASNQENYVPPYLDDPDDQSYKEDPSYTRITVNVNDVVDEPPVFAQPVFTAGVATFLNSNVTLDNSTIKATDKDSREIDAIRYVLDLENIIASDLSLENIQKPQFELQDLGEDGAILRRKFVPQSAHSGYFQFDISAYDKLDLTGKVTVRVFFVRPEHAISFVFSNDYIFVGSKRSIIESLFSEAYGYICNVDNIDQTRDGSSGAAEENSTTVETHFVDIAKNEIVPANIIDGWLYGNPNKLSELITKLNSEGIVMKLDNPSENEPIDSQQIIIYVLVAGCAVLGVVLLILGASCYFRNRGMERKVRALSAGAAPQVGMKEKGTDEILPGTNAFALKGSNPIWAEEGDAGNRINKFADNESITSGGSILVGVELEDDFKGHEERENPAFEDEFQSENEDDGHLYGSIRNPAYNDTYEEPGTDNYTYPTAASLSSDSKFNPMGSVARRNPLVSLIDD